MNKALASAKKVDDLLTRADDALNGLRAKVDEVNRIPRLQMVGDKTAVLPTNGDKSIAWSLWSEFMVSVVRSLSHKGTHIKDHAHEEREWIIVYDGYLQITIDDVTTDVKTGEHVLVPAGVLHGIYCKEDTKCVIVTVPRTEDWPG